MRPLDLTLNGQPVDLPASLKGLVRLSQARAQLADLAARVGEFSFPLTLPATQANARIFGVDKLHELGLGKFGPAVDYAYELQVGGQQFAGTFRLTGLKNGYTGSLIGDGLSWALLLGDSKLTDLQFTEVDYDGSQLEATMALDCDATDLQFPLVAYGNFFAPPTTRTLPDGTSQEVPAPPSSALTYALAVDDYPPGVYYVNVLRTIFASIGWQLRGRELDSDFWRAVVLSAAGADVGAAWNWGRLLQARQAGAVNIFSYYQDSSGNYRNSNGSFDQNQNGEVVYLPLAARLVASPTRALAAPAASYTAPRDGTYSFAWSATLRSARQSWQRLGLGNGYDNYFQPVGLGLVVCRGGQGHTGADGGLVTGPFGLNVPGYAAGQDRVLTPQRLDTGGTGLAVGASFQEAADVYLEAGDLVQLACFMRRRLFTDDGTLRMVRTEFVAEWTGVAFACTGYADNDGVSKLLLQPAEFLPPLGSVAVVKDFLVRTNSFLVPDVARRVATLYTRGELSQAAGAPIDLSALVEPRALDYLPTAGAGVGSYLFSPASVSDDPLVSADADVVQAPIGPGAGISAVGSVYAVAGFRTYYTRTQALVLPCLSTKDVLAQNCSEVQWEVSAQPPRLLRYLGPSADSPVPFGQRFVPVGQSEWAGALAWDGLGGAVATYYADTIKRALRGHLAKVAIPISPALYAAMQPGRRVEILSAGYSVESVENFDPADEAGLTNITLSREVL